MNKLLISVFIPVLLLAAIYAGEHTPTPSPTPSIESHFEDYRGVVTPEPHFSDYKGVKIIRGDSPMPSPTFTPRPIPTPGPDPENMILCVVDDRMLSQADVDDMLEVMLKKETGDKEYLDRVRRVYTQNIMTEWLERTLLAVEAESEGITVTDEEIRQQEALLKSAADVQFDIAKALEEMGHSHDEYLRQLKDALLGEKLIKRRIPVYYTEDDLKRIYLSDPRAFQRPPRVRVSHVFCPLTGRETDDEFDEREDFMKDARKAAKKDKDLEEFASRAPPEFNCIGGDMGWLYPTNRLPRPINSLVFQIDPGDVSDIEHTDYGFYVIRIDDKQPLSGLTYDEAREAVHDAVFEDVRKKVLDLARKRHRVLININGIPLEKLTE